MAGLEVCRNLNLERVERCMSVMQSGTQMVKLKTGSKGLVRLFYLDEHRSCIRWKPSRKSEKAKITIDSLYKVTEGGQSDIFHRQAEGSFDPACCFTVYHGNHMESLDLVTSSADEARTWITGLSYLMAGISDEDSLAKRQRAHDQWMKQTFEEADKNGDGLLNIDEIYQLLHKLNVNLPRRKVKQMFQEADTDDQQGTLTYEEFSVFYRMMSLRRDLFLLMMAYSNRKDHLTADELADFLQNEQKMTNVTLDLCAEIIDKFEVTDENKEKGVMGIEAFTSFMRSPTCDIFNPLLHEVNQDMDQPLSNYFIASSHNTYLTGDQLLSHSKADMYAWVLQSGCRCVEVDCWDGADGEPMVQHGYTLTSKIPFKAVIETINKYAFVNNPFPVILSIENHCNIQQQKKISQYLREIFGDKLDLGGTISRDAKTLPSPQSLQGKILIKGKRLPAYLSADAEEGDVSDDDSADEIEDDFKLKNSNSHGNPQVESHIRKKLDSLLKESLIGDKEDTDSFSIRALLRATHQGLQKNLRQSSKNVLKKSQSRSFITTLKQKRHSKSRLSCQTGEKDEDEQERSGREAAGQNNRVGRKRKTMKLSRDLSNLVVFTNSVASQECLNEGTPGDVLSFSETRAQSLVHHKTEQFLTFNQRQLSRIYPSAYRIDSSNFNPQFYWNVGCHLVALNYQTEGRMMQLNRAKFMVNGNSGYVLKPPAMCKGSFNPFSDDPLPAFPKKQLILKIISGQQLPKPPDSMLGDRGEIIDPFVEVEIIGLPVDCCKEQTRVVDDNGFNPVWEETLVFTLHMADLALVRFLVWDHDPIGRDFIGERTVAFSSLMPGYRHVYLEGLTEASIFVHVSVHDVYGKWSPLVLNPSFTIMNFLGANKAPQLRGIRSLFTRSSRPSADTNSCIGPRKRSISEQLLRRTASAPAKGRKKTKMVLSESVVSEQKNGSGAGGGGGGEVPAGKEGGTEKRLVPRPPLTHRPVSLPLDRLLEGQLSLCPSDQDKKGVVTDAFIGSGLFDRTRSSSVDLLIESSTSLHQNPRSPPTSYVNTNKELHPCEDGSYLVIGGRDVKDEEEEGGEENGTNDESAKISFSRSSEIGPKRSDQPDASSNSTIVTVAPSSSSSSSPTPSSVAFRLAVSMNRGHLGISSPLHDSAISRQIDAVSLGNEQDTCGSISALISQCDSTGHSTIHPSNIRSPTPSKTLQGFAVDKKHPNSPRKDAQKRHHLGSQGVCSPQTNSPGDPPPPHLLSSPETTEFEEVYTILDEEVLMPMSGCNQRENIVYFQADIPEQTSSNRLGSCAAQVAQGWRSNMNWNDLPRHEDGGDNAGEPEESVYEEVYDPPGSIMEPRRCVSTTPFRDKDCFKFVHNSEMEINVDEDPLETTRTSTRHCSPWVSITKPPKCHAIYQNYESTPTCTPKKHLLTYDHPQQRAPDTSPLLRCSSALNQPPRPMSNVQVMFNDKHSPFHRPKGLHPSNPSPLHHTTVPISERNKEAFSKPNAQRNPSSNQINNRHHQNFLKDKDMKKEKLGCFHNGYPSSEHLPGQSRVSTSICGHRGPYSPIFDGIYSDLDYDYIDPPTGTHSQSHSQAETSKKTTNLKDPTIKGHQPQPETRTPLDPRPQSTPIHTPAQCKSKSLGDLTSEDISCNFQSKYHMISRSFITPRLRNQTLPGSTGSVRIQSKSCDPLTEQLRKLVSMEGDDSDSDKASIPRVHQGTTPTQSHPEDDSPPPLTRRLSSRSQSRVRHINNRARERQQEALKPRPGVAIDTSASISGVVLRNKPASQIPPVNRHSTGSYIAGYLEDRGLPEGACTSIHYGYGDRRKDQCYTDDSLPAADSAHSREPEVYFLLRL